MSIRDLPPAQVGARPGVRSDVAPTVINRWCPDVRSASDESETTISILDVIGQDWWGDGVTAKRVAAALRQIGDRPVTVTVNSPGGDFFEGLAIYNLLREHPAQVTVKILGLAASAASVIAMAGDEVLIGRAGFLMIHNTWVLAAGDRNALREVADWLEPFDNASVDIYAARTGLAAGKIGSMLDRETWIGGQAAVDQGFADGLLSADDIATDVRERGRDGPRAERRFDLVAARAGLSRSDARELLATLKGGKPGAALTGMQDAAVATEVADLLNRLKSM